MEHASREEEVSIRIDRLSKRYDQTKKWLLKHASNCVREQKHLDNGSIEQAYWHYGYAVALQDTLSLLNGKVDIP